MATKLSLVAVPVYPAAVSGADIHLNQLHAFCKSRINYKKTCRLHGEVPSEDIVSGYEFAKGQSVIVDKEELVWLRPLDGILLMTQLHNEVLI